MIPADQAPNDTDKSIEPALLKMLREAPSWRKAAMVDSLTRACQELAAAGIRMRHPEATKEEIRMRVASLWLDRDIMIRVLGWDPAQKGY